MTIPLANEVINISNIIPILREMLNYCAAQAVLANEPGSLSYEAASDEITYHIQVHEFDRELFDVLHGVDEIWIVTSARSES